MYAIQKTVLTLVLMVFATTVASTSIAGNDNNFSATPTKYVGTFYTDGGAMVTIHSDGTMEHIVDDMFSRANRRVSPALGVWGESGKNEIKVTWVRFATEEFGDNFSPNGLISRLSYVMVFDKPVGRKCPGYTVGSVLIEQFSVDQNPVTDEPMLSFEVPSNTTGIRLEVK